MTSGNGAIWAKRRVSSPVVTMGCAFVLALLLARVALAATVENDAYCDWFGAWLFNWFYCH